MDSFRFAVRMATQTLVGGNTPAYSPVTHPVIAEIHYYYTLGSLGTAHQIATAALLVPERVKLTPEEAGEVDFLRILTLPDPTESRTKLFELVNKRNDASYAAALSALVTSKDKNSPTPASMKDDLKQAIKSCSLYARIVVARYFILSRKFDKARPLMEQLLQRSSSGSDCRVMALGAHLYFTLACEELYSAPIFVSATPFRNLLSSWKSGTPMENFTNGTAVVESRGSEEVASKVRLAASLFGRAKQIADKVLGENQMAQPDPLAQLTFLAILRMDRDWPNAAINIKTLQKYGGSISSLGHAEKMQTFLACGFSHWEKASSAAMLESSSSASVIATLLSSIESGSLNSISPEDASKLTATIGKMPLTRLPKEMSLLAQALTTLCVKNNSIEASPQTAIQNFFSALSSEKSTQNNSPSTIAMHALRAGKLLTNAAILGEACTQPTGTLKLVAQSLSSRRDPSCVWFISHLQNLLGYPAQASKILDKAAKFINANALVTGIRGAVDAASVALTRFQICLASALQQVAQHHVVVAPMIGGIEAVKSAVDQIEASGQATMLYIPDDHASSTSLLSQNNTSVPQRVQSPISIPRGTCISLPDESSWLNLPAILSAEEALMELESLILPSDGSQSAPTHYLAWMALGRAATCLVPFMDLASAISTCPASAMNVIPKLPLRHVPTSVIERPAFVAFVAAQIILAADLQTAHVHGCTSGPAGSVVRDFRGDPFVHYDEAKGFEPLPEVFSPDEPAYRTVVEAAQCAALGGKPPLSYEALEAFDAYFARLLLQCCFTLLAITPRCAMTDLPMLDSVQRCLSRSLHAFARSAWLHSAIIRLTASREDLFQHSDAKNSASSIGAFTPMFANAHCAAAASRLGLNSAKDLGVNFPVHKASSLKIFPRKDLFLPANINDANQSVSDAYKSAVRLLGGKATTLVEKASVAEAAFRESYVSPFPPLADAITSACSHALSNDDGASASEPIPRVLISPFSKEANEEWGHPNSGEKGVELANESAQPSVSSNNDMSQETGREGTTLKVHVDESEQQKILAQLLRSQQQQQQQQQQQHEQQQRLDQTSESKDKALNESGASQFDQDASATGSILTQLDAVLFAGDSTDNHEIATPETTKSAAVREQIGSTRILFSEPEDDLLDEGIVIVGDHDQEDEEREREQRRKANRNEDFYSNAGAALDAATAAGLDHDSSDFAGEDEDPMLDVPTLPTHYIEESTEGKTPKRVSREPSLVRRESSGEQKQTNFVHSEDLEEDNQRENDQSQKQSMSEMQILELQKNQIQHIPKSKEDKSERAVPDIIPKPDEKVDMNVSKQPEAQESEARTNKSSTDAKAPEQKSTPAVSQETASFDPNSDEWRQATAFVRHALGGEVFLKYGRYGKPHDRTVVVRILRDNLTVCVDWGTGQMKFTKQHVKIVEGKVTEVFRKSSYSKVPEELCFSIVTAERTLDLQAQSRKNRDYWVQGLRLMIFFLWDR